MDVVRFCPGALQVGFPDGHSVPVDHKTKGVDSSPFRPAAPPLFFLRCHFLRLLLLLKSVHLPILVEPELQPELQEQIDPLHHPVKLFLIPVENEDVMKAKRAPERKTLGQAYDAYIEDHSMLSPSTYVLLRHHRQHHLVQQYVRCNPYPFV